MQVKVPGFDLTLKVVWIIAGVVWSALLVGVTSYITYKTTLSHIENKVEQTTDQVSGLTSTFQDRTKVTDGRFEKLETGQVKLETGQIQMQSDVKAIQSEQKTFRESTDKQFMQLQFTLNTLVSAIINKEKTADSQPLGVRPASYEAR